MAKLAFVAPPFAGHLNPLAALALAAQAAGHTVEMVTGHAKLDVLAEAGLSAVAPPSLGSDALEAIADAPHRVGIHPMRIARQLRASFAAIRAVRDELVEAWTLDPPDLVIADFITIAPGLAADALGLPWITTLPTPFALEASTGPPSYLGGLQPMPGALGRLRDRAGWAAVKAGKGLLAGLFGHQMAAMGLRRLRPDGSEAIYSRERILALGLKELEFERDWPVAVRFIGPLHDNPEPGLQLEFRPGPKVLLTLGTHLPWAKRTLIDDARALSTWLPDMQFVVSLGRPAARSRTPVFSEGNVEAYAFVPYGQYLTRFDAVIHHGGAGIASACIAAGKPMLAVPHDYDQFDYAARIEHHQLGFRANRIGHPDTATKLRRLLSVPMQGTAKFAAYAKAYDPRRAFLEEVDAIVDRQGKSRCVSKSSLNDEHMPSEPETGTGEITGPESVLDCERHRS
jgi:UDP:flavonoid glycosyltransferase YjiC (YdhE family)